MIWFLSLLTAAHAADPREELRAAFGDVELHADHVFVFDSGRGEHARAQGALTVVAGLAAGLPTGDRVAVLGFADEAVSLLAPTEVTEDPAARAALRAELGGLSLPTGGHSDLGAALRGVGDLLRGASAESQFVYLFSDFCHDPPAGSPWSFDGVDGCRQVRGQRNLASAIERLPGTLSPIAVGLGTPDRDGLRAFFQVLGDGETVDLRRTEVGTWAEHFGADLEWRKLAAVARKELEQVDFSAELGPVETTVEGAVVPVTVHSGLTHLSITLDSVQVKGDERVTPRSGRLLLEPDGALELALKLPDTPFSPLAVEREIVFEGELRGTGTVEPRRALARLEIAPGLGVLTSPFRVAVVQRYGWPIRPEQLGWAGLLLVLGALGWQGARGRRR